MTTALPPVAHDSSPTGVPTEPVVLRHARHVLDVDLGGEIPGISRVRASDHGDGVLVEAPQAWVLLRLFGEPVGVVELDVPPDGLGPSEVEVLVAPLGTPSSVARGEGTEYSRAHAAYLGVAPRCSVIVCTRDHPESLRRCLTSLRDQDHRDFAVWVVDNAPTNSATRQVVEDFSSLLDVRYALEPTPGLSRARNAALALPLEGEVAAWLDDDEVADPTWVSELLRGFDGRPDVAAVSGVVVPAELATLTQVWFEQFGGHSKGRGFRRAEFSPATWRDQHPLYPLPPFGVGANMAFRIDRLRAAGGFDEALGAGTRTRGSEDTKIFTDLLLRGATVVYQPTALTRHFHRTELHELRSQLYGYGSGLTAFYLATVLERPSALLTLARLAPRALREVLGSSGLRTATLQADFPVDILSANRRGMLAGPWLYLCERAERRRRRTVGSVR